MNIKVLTHFIRFSDGNVSPSWISAGSLQFADRIVADVKAGKYDRETYAVRMRRYPIERHLKDVAVSRVW
jgi:hypothetical protein